MALRVTRQHGEVLAAGEGELRVSRQHAEVLAGGIGELRVTRQHAEILAAGDGKVRITRQYVEVLAQTWSTIEKDLSHNMSLTQNLVRGPLDLTRSLTSNVSITQNLAYGQTLTEDVGTTMNLTSVVSRVKEASASNTMNLTQAILKLHIIDDFIPMASVISFVQQADWWVGLYKSLIQSMVLTHQLDWQGPHYHYINTYLTVLSHDVDAYHGCPWLPVEFEDELNLVSSMNKAYDLVVTSTLTLNQDAYWSETPSSTLNLVQTVSDGKAKNIPTSDLDLEHTVNLTGVWERDLEHPNVVGHALTYYVETDCVDKQYSPHIGENTISGAPTPPTIIAPEVPHDPTTTRFKLQYPALAAATDTVELRAPELDNIDRVSFTRISRETRGGKLTVFADPTWPKVQTVIATFIGLTETEKNDVLDFFLAHIGEEISMQDWEGREWVGIVSTPNESAVQDGKSCTGRGWTLTFEFEGVLVEGYTPGDQLNLVDTLAATMEYDRPLTHDLALIQEATFIKV